MNMERIVYVNGEFVPESEARVSVFDRGFLMADAVYEVTSVIDGKLIDFGAHVGRLNRSLSELNLANPLTEDALLAIHRDLIRKNGVDEGLVYMQITRGAADRDFLYPESSVPTVVMFTQKKMLAESVQARTGIRVILVDDLRWGRRDIKTVQLLFASMAKMMAKSKGADDAWLVENGQITEGTSNNAWIVRDNRIITRHLSDEILHGITRAAVIGYAESRQMTVEERAFTVEEAFSANEAFITAASTFVMPVISIDGRIIGEGKPGPVAIRLRKIYLEESRARAV